MTLVPSDFEITDGYVGSFGKAFKVATEETLSKAIGKAAERYGTTSDEIERRLHAGQPVTWCDSPNFYYDHSHGIIRRRSNIPQPVEKLCDCGHYSAHPMMASRGTACPDCYDDWSD